MKLAPWGAGKTVRTRRTVALQSKESPYWSRPIAEVMTSLGATTEGLLAKDAAERLVRYGTNELESRSQVTAIGLFLNQFKSPLVLILIAASSVSFAVQEWIDAGVVLAVVLGSTILGFIQEFVAGNAIEALRSQVTITCRVVRDGKIASVRAADVVPGDIVLLSAGSLIPADGRVVDAKDFFVNQAVLTGETFPVEKKPGDVGATEGLSGRTNCVFMGTSVRSGTSRVLITTTGKSTNFGQIAERLRLRPPMTDFERGLQRFGYLLTRIMLVMVVLVLAINVLLGRPPLGSLLFALALAVGLTPELLPAIVSIALSHGAKRMAAKGVIVRRLNAIENFGSIDVLCTDKTGTLTAGVVELDRALDAEGETSAFVLRQAYLNAHFQTGLDNALDEAVVSAATRDHVDITGTDKVDEVPYDFVRKCLSVVVANAAGERTLITKGALEQILAKCSTVQGKTDAAPFDEAVRARIMARFVAWSGEGFRVLGVATKPVPGHNGAFRSGDESALTFAGFLLFFDPPKADVIETVTALASRGVQLKIITGDNVQVAMHVAESVKLPVEGVLSGKALNTMSDEALWHAAEHTTVFAEVDPNQKERIILALRKTGHVVGYLGDGINDAPALHAADVGLSVDTAVDVAKDAADFVLLRKGLDILPDAIDEGRRTFANTLKYILTTISANFGNMFSMVAASAFLPFLPLLASQILLNNFLSDIPATTIASDSVDPEWTAKPRRWDTVFIRNYMVLFGLVSSVFDILTFVVLLRLFRSSPEQFRTGWFIESLLTELVVALVVRTRRLFFRSRPGRALLWSTVVVVVVALLTPYIPGHTIFGFVPLSAPLMLTLCGLTVLYVLSVEAAKKFFYARWSQP